MKSLIITALGCYLSIVVLIYIFQRNLMYAPGHDVSSPQASQVPEMSVYRLSSTDGLEITSWYAPPASNEMSVVIIYHGNAGTIASRAFKARYFLDAGYGVLLVGYRGYADNSGKPDEQGLYGDARTALEFLTREGIPSERWVFYGESLGCAIAVQMALEAERGQLSGTTGIPGIISGLILEAPFTSMPQAAAYHYPWLPARWLVKDKFRSIDKISALKTPVLIVHGEQDRTIPQSHGKKLYEQITSPKKGLWIKKAGHNDLYDFDAGLAIVEWISETESQIRP